MKHEWRLLIAVALVLFLAYLSSPWVQTVVGFIAALFPIAEGALSTTYKKQIADSLLRATRKQYTLRWPLLFVKVFDSVFDSQPLSAKRISRSVVASIVTVSLLAFLYESLGWATWQLVRIAVVQENQLVDPSYWQQPSGLEEWIVVLSSIGGAAMFLNVTVDYFSLLETRWVMIRLSQRPSTVRILLWLAIDALVTACLFLAYVAVLGRIIAADGNLKPLVVNGPEGVTELPLLTLMSLGEPGKYFIAFVPYLQSTGWRAAVELGLFFGSTFFTSVWVWLYGASGLCFRLLYHSQLGAQSFMRWLVAHNVLNIQDKPVLSIGLLASSLVSVIGLGMQFLGRVFELLGFM